MFHERSLKYARYAVLAWYFSYVCNNFVSGERGWNRSTCVRCRVIAQVFTYHIIVSACACLCSLSAQTIGLCLSASYFSPVGWHIHAHQHSQTHTHLIYTQFLLASVKLQQFRDSKTGTIWSSLPASHFLPPPCSNDDDNERERDKQMNEKEK